MRTEYTFITKENQITVYINGNAYTATSEHPNYQKVIDAIKTGEPHETMINLLDTTKAVREYLATSGDISVANGVVTYKGVELQNVLTVKILRMLKEGFDIKPMLNFLNNLRKNPSKSAQDELILFLEVNEMPITPDGCFLAYKSVRNDYMDMHSGTFSNKVGEVCKMARHDVDDRRDVTCSTGLHAANKSYAGTFGGSGKLMTLKINPRDVVSVPNDYNNAKLRCCEYTVIGEVEREPGGADAYNQKAVYDEDESEYWECDECGTMFDYDHYDGTCPDCGEEH